MEFRHDRPIYLQIVEEIERRIVRGELPPGAQIPSVRELAAGLRVNPNTVQRAYQELERRGIIFTLRGQGTYVRQDPDMVAQLRVRAAREAARRFWAETRALGLTPEETLAFILETGHTENGGEGTGGNGC